MRHLAACVMLLAGAAWPSGAQTVLTVKQAVDQAVQSHPLLSFGRARVAVAQGLARQAALRPNPRLFLQSENTRLPREGSFSYPRDTDNFALWQQVLETAGKRGLRTEYAEAGVERAALEQEVTRLQVAGRVRQAYWTASGARQVAKLYTDELENYDRIVDYHAVRFREGKIAELDLLRIQLERDRVAIAANEARLEAERARLQLYREMGQTEFPEVDLEPSVEPALAASRADIAAALQQRPEVRLARQQVRQSQANVSLQRALAHPDPEVTFGYKRTAGLDTVVGGVQMFLPFLNRNQGNVAAAESEVRASESNLAVNQAIIAAEVRTAEAELTLRRRLLETTLRPLMERSDQTARIADAAYREGGTDLLRVLDAQRVRLEALVQYTRSLSQYQQSLAALETALGLLP